MNKSNFGWFLKGFAFLAILLIAGITICGVQFSLAQVSGTDDTTIVNKAPEGQYPVEDGESSAPLIGESVVSYSSSPDPNAQAGVLSGIKPDDPDVITKRSEAIPPGWMANFKYVAGSTFQPRASAYTYGESGNGGCIYAIGDALGTYIVDLQLPDGAIVDIVRMYYYDSSAETSHAWLTQYDGAGGFGDIAAIQSSGNTGYGTAAAFPEYTVDTYNLPLALNWRSYTTGTSMALCGMRIRYWTPAPAIWIPIVQR